MAAGPPISQRILDAAEEVLRRHGAEKANVVDIARVLGMSHANIYRHFPSKKALLDAVAERWLHAVSAPLEIIVADVDRPAGERLADWFDGLRGAKRRKVLDDPELFRVYHGITENAHEVVELHVASLLDQVERIVTDGIAAGEFSADLAARAAARAFLQATAPFHHPALIVRGLVPSEGEAQTLFCLLLKGLQNGAHPAAPAG